VLAGDSNNDIFASTGVDRPLAHTIESVGRIRWRQTRSRAAADHEPSDVSGGEAVLVLALTCLNMDANTCLSHR
jgi:hypothetical protein